MTLLVDVAYGQEGQSIHAHCFPSFLSERKLSALESLESVKSVMRLRKHIVLFATFVCNFIRCKALQILSKSVRSLTSLARLFTPYTVAFYRRSDIGQKETGIPNCCALNGRQRFQNSAHAHAKQDSKWICRNSEWCQPRALYKPSMRGYHVLRDSLLLLPSRKFEERLELLSWCAFEQLRMILSLGRGSSREQPWSISRKVAEAAAGAGVGAALFLFLLLLLLLQLLLRYQLPAYAAAILCRPRSLDSRRGAQPARTATDPVPCQPLIGVAAAAAEAMPLLYCYCTAALALRLRLLPLFAPAPAHLLLPCSVHYFYYAFTAQADDLYDVAITMQTTLVEFCYSRLYLKYLKSVAIPDLNKTQINPPLTGIGKSSPNPEG